MARPIKGEWIQKSLPKTASVTFTAGDIVMMTSGYVATATNQATRLLGIIPISVTSGDSDFADTNNVPVMVPVQPTAEFECEVTGTFVTTSIGVAYDLTDANTVNQAGTTYKVALAKTYVSSTKGNFVLCGNADFHGSA